MELNSLKFLLSKTIGFIEKSKTALLQFFAVFHFVFSNVILLMFLLLSPHVTAMKDDFSFW